MGWGGGGRQKQRESDRYLILKDKDLGRNLVYTNRGSDRYLKLKDKDLGRRNLVYTNRDSDRYLILNDKDLGSDLVYTNRESDRYLILKDKDLGRNLVYANRESDRYLILKDKDLGRNLDLHSLDLALTKLQYALTTYNNCYNSNTDTMVNRYMPVVFSYSRTFPVFSCFGTLG